MIDNSPYSLGAKSLVPSKPLKVIHRPMCPYAKVNMA